jgi:hypothetical protein
MCVTGRGRWDDATHPSHPLSEWGGRFGGFSTIYHIRAIVNLRTNTTETALQQLKAITESGTSCLYNNQKR